MKNLLTYTVAATLGLVNLPAHAQDFDLPPDLVISGQESVLTQEDTVETTGVSEEKARSATLATEFRAFHFDELSGGNSAALRVSAHYFGTFELSDRASLLFNLRGRIERAEGQTFSLDQSVNLDVQELAISYTVSPQVSLQFGRINIRNGVAVGFNPTDWFKDNSLVTAESAAPADRRRERLGVFAVTGTATVGNTLLQMGYRPKISASTGSVFSDMDSIGLGLDRTNPSDAFFIKATPQFGSNLSVTGNFLLNDGDPGLGFEVSGTIGDNLVLYGEAFAEKRLSIASEALAGGLGSAAFQQGLGVSNQKDWELTAALGLNWALPQSFVGARDISVVLEYHLNTAGLTGSQIDTLASATGADGLAAGAVYGTASRRQEPLARNQIFTRIAWNDFWGDSDLSALGFYVPADGSGLAQISVDVPIGQNATLNLRGISTFGSSTSIYGANPTRRSLQLGMTYVF
ncbi:hypothetical protein [Litoreibacter janthinus]|uniref:Uncharacterized protein n=1 Tax=Litoreibacter janthinus TaxID=670154 RepID=A0A1I6GD09_9RHOB|nr:hypothetical protein [Litoreibacter janthinus]SFR40069.1 hypothetical protein SAMN04488002_1263 [Litoreibacter janthinus]